MAIEDASELRTSRMETELHKRKLDKIKAEREKLNGKLIKDTEDAFNGVIVSNVKALQDLSKKLNATNGTKVNGSATASSLVKTSSKELTAGITNLVQHAQTQITLLKSIDQSLLKVTTLLQPQFDAFQRGLDKIKIKLDDKKPITVYQSAQDPKRNAFKKALDTIFGVGAAPQEVYVSNWKEIKEGRARTRKDLQGIVGQILSNGAIGSMLGLGTNFQRTVRHENNLHQTRRMITEVKQGGDPAEVLAREAKAARLTEIENKWSGGQGKATAVYWTTLLSTLTKEGREAIKDQFGKVLSDAGKAQKALALADLASDVMDGYKGKDANAKYGAASKSIREAALKRTGGRQYKDFADMYEGDSLNKEFDEEWDKSVLAPLKSVKIGSFEVGKLVDYLSELQGKIKNIDKAKAYEIAKDYYSSASGKVKNFTAKEVQHIKQIATVVQKVSKDAAVAVADKTISGAKYLADNKAVIAEAVVKAAKVGAGGAAFVGGKAIEYGGKATKGVRDGVMGFVEFASNINITLKSTSVILLKMMAHLKGIRKNTDTIVELLKAGNLGKGKDEEKKGFIRRFFGFLNKARGDSFKMTGVGGGMLKTVGSVLALPFIGAKNILGVGFGLLGKLFGSGSFKLSGIGGGTLAKLVKAPFSLVKGALGLTGSVGGAVASGIGKVIGKDSFRLRKGKGKATEKALKSPWAIEDTTYMIYKLLDKRLPGQSESREERRKRLAKALAGPGVLSRAGKFAGKQAGFIGNMLKGLISNPTALAAMMAAGSVAAGVGAITGVISERRDHAKAMDTSVNDKALSGTYARQKKAYGLSADELLKLNASRKSKGLNEISNLTAYSELKKKGIDVNNSVVPVTAAKASQSITTAVAAAPNTGYKVIEGSSTPQQQSYKKFQQVSYTSGELAISTPNLLRNTGSGGTEDARMNKMMKFLIGEFTNNLVVNLGKSLSGSTGNSTSTVNKNSATPLNVFK